jgi:SAM-dependent methyltransferase
MALAGRGQMAAAKRPGAKARGGLVFSGAPAGTRAPGGIDELTGAILGGGPRGGEIENAQVATLHFHAGSVRAAHQDRRRLGQIVTGHVMPEMMLEVAVDKVGRNEDPLEEIGGCGARVAQRIIESGTTAAAPATGLTARCLPRSAAEAPALCAQGRLRHDRAVTQNMYDDPVFFAGYARLRRSREGLEGAPEWPSLRALLPPVHGLRVVDLGCGYGWFCRWASDAGAQRVLGLDVSERMLAQARAQNSGLAITYDRVDLEHLSLPSACFDLAYSSLALHYVADFAGLARCVRDSLVEGGRFVFSIEHPIYMASRAAQWLTDASGRASWPVDGYCREGPRTTSWLKDGVVKVHRTIATTLNTLISAGFVIRHVQEFGPSQDQVAALPELELELERPMFLIVSAQR